jgi:alkylation response protein AidB-like acyl-CoA dehydrogenase
MSLTSDLKNVSAEDRRMLEQAEAMLGPEPSEMGVMKNMFWGRLRRDLVFPFPRESADERARTDALIAELDGYLANEHPSIWIDQNEEVPDWVLERLFQMGVMGMTIPEQYGGLGLGVTSYNRVLERIGSRCASTAVIVSAHQSIGCKAIMLFGTEEQKERWLPKVAREYLSAFCLSEPNVGCDAAGQETTCTRSEDGRYYILNGEKKWSTSGAIAGLFTVAAKQTDLDVGSDKSPITALVCHPDMPGVHIFEKNRSKCGIRGTWQARIRFENVRVPIENRLHKEGRGLQVALTCLNFGRCTLSAGMLGAARSVMQQSVKWSRTRYQFGRPLSDFELVQKRIARMSALTYAMDAVLYAMTGMLDRDDPDIMVETAATKVFCSEMGWRVVNDGMQVMGGESYVTENEVERAFRDTRIYLIVEGANEVMQSFIFGYGGKQLAEYMLGINNAVGWDADASIVSNAGRVFRNGVKPQILRRAIPLGMELLLNRKPRKPATPPVSDALRPMGERLAALVRDQSHAFKKASMRYQEQVVSRQTIQARLSDNFMHLFAMACSLSKLDSDLASEKDERLRSQARTAVEHFFDLAELQIQENTRRLFDNGDESMRASAAAAIAFSDAQANERFVIPEGSPVARGTGRNPDQTHIRQFPGDEPVPEPGTGVRAKAEHTKTESNV